MHHFIFCKKDSLIYNDESVSSKNFGLDPYIEVGCVNKLSRTFKTSSLVLMGNSNELIARYVHNFNGIFTGALFCSTGSISGSVNCNCDPTRIVDEFNDSMIDESGNFIWLIPPEDIIP